MEPSPALSIQLNMKETLEGRTVGVLVDNNSDAAVLKSLCSEVEAAGGRLFVVAPKIHGLTLSDGKPCKADGQLAGSPSQLFDAVAVILEEDEARFLVNEAAAVQWVMDAYGHLKAIGFDEHGSLLIARAGLKAEEGVQELGSGFAAAASRRYWDREPNVRTLA
jgi:catalase